MKALKQLSIIGLTGLLVACGGGGSSTPASNTGGTTSGGNTGGSTGGSTGGQAATLESEFSKWIIDMADGYIMPAYKDLAAANMQLQQAAQACSVTGFNQTQLEQIQTRWQQAFNQWQGIQWLKLGPVVEQSKLFRFQFFPDGNDAVKRGVDLLLSTNETITAEFLATKQVGAQGFPALERLLYPQTPADSLLTAENRAKRCEAVQGIAANLVNISEQINTAWSAQGGNYRANFVDGTGEFTGKVDVVEEVVTNYLEHLELVKDEKLLHPVSLQKPGIPTIAESPFSDISLSHVQVNVQALFDIYTAKGGHGFDDILTNHLEQTSIATQMNDALTKTQTAINSLSGSFEQALNDDAKRETLNEVINSLRDLRTVLTADFVQAMDLNIGFNSNDGD